MFKKQGFVDHNLIKIKDKLAEVSGAKNQNEEELQPKNEKDFHNQQIQNSSKANLVQLQTPKIAGGSKTAISPVLKDETRAALEKRKEEFRLLKRDICEKLSEKLSSFPEDIRITERKLEELKNAIEKFASLIDELKTVDEHSWDENTLHTEIGRACRKAENARLEYIRICSRLAALQRESSAAEESTTSKGASPLHELCSMSLKQGLKIGFSIFLPLICALIIASIIIAIAYILALKS